MEFKNTLEIVTKDIQDIEKLVSNFKNYSRIPNIELDLALSRLRNVYDLLLMFRDDSKHEVPEQTSITNIKETAPVKKPDTKVSAEPIPVITDEPAGVVTESADNINNPSSEISAPVIEAKVPTPVPSNEKQTAKKKPAEEKQFVHEKLGEHAHKKDITSKLQGQAISSISGSLGINDKFFFIRELFAGNAETFRQTMEELDLSHNFNDAYSLLLSKFQWDMDSEAVQMLLNLIRRKFITSGNE